MSQNQEVRWDGFSRPSFSIPPSGSVISQGDRAMRSDIARQLFALDGTGITIGVLSNSFDFLEGAAADIKTGDLPGPGNPYGRETPVKILLDWEPSEVTENTDEGRAMLQIIHDIAPAAKLLFYTAMEGVNEFAQGIRELANAGADIIVDDIAYLAEPFFQDGPIAQAVDDVADDGVLYFSAAGNEGRSSYQSEFRLGREIVTQQAKQSQQKQVERFHDFDPGKGVSIFQKITLTDQEPIQLVLQWDEPFASLGQAGSRSDLTLRVYDADGNLLADSNSFDPEGNSNLGRDAVDRLVFINTTGETADFYLAIVNTAGPDPGLIQYINYVPTLSQDNAEFFTESPTVVGHANAAGAIAVGAIDYLHTPAFGEKNPLPNFYSSAGGVPILFDEDGNRLDHPIIRNKPEIIAPDTGNTTFLGGMDRPEDKDSFPNFPGTSAAAPHAAAVAALMLQADPNASRDDILKAMQATAIDLGEKGFDFDSGAGLLQADAAIEHLILSGTLLDLRQVSGEVPAEFLVNQEAASDDFVGFYKVTDFDGGIDLNGDSQADLYPGDAGYRNAAIKEREAQIDLSANNKQSAKFTAELEGGAIYAPFLISQKTSAKRDSAPVYFPFLEANPDGLGHIRLLGKKHSFGFENSLGLSSHDYNDVTVSIKVQSSSFGVNA